MFDENLCLTDMHAQTKFCAIFSGEWADTDAQAGVKHEISFIRPIGVPIVRPNLGMLYSTSVNNS